MLLPAARPGRPPVHQRGDEGRPCVRFVCGSQMLLLVPRLRCVASSLRGFWAGSWLWRAELRRVARRRRLGRREQVVRIPVIDSTQGGFEPAVACACGVRQCGYNRGGGNTHTSLRQGSRLTGKWIWFSSGDCLDSSAGRPTRATLVVKTFGVFCRSSHPQSALCVSRPFTRRSH